MTYKEAFGIQTISYAHNTPHENIEEAREKLFEACWKVDKYRWHDLRKDPEDLPEKNTDKKLLCVVHSPIRFFWKYYVCRCVNGVFYDFYGNFKIANKFEFQKVIAWKEIDLFEEK